MLKDEGQILMQCFILFSDPTINAVRSKPPERRDEQVDHDNSVK